MTHRPSQPEVQEDVQALVQLPAPPEVRVPVPHWAEVQEEVLGLQVQKPLQVLAPSGGRGLLSGLLRQKTSLTSNNVHGSVLTSYRQVALLRGPERGQGPRGAAGFCRTGSDRRVSFGAAGRAPCWCLKGGSDAQFGSDARSVPAA